MWDREDSRTALWGWRLARKWPGRIWGDIKSLSSSEPRAASVQEPRKPDKQGDDPWENWNKQWHQDYESFKAAVDKAIDRDPYGTLFGRHLRSPLSAKNSGWTAWSWVFEPKTSSEPVPENGDKIQKNSDAAPNPQGTDKSSDSRATFSVPLQTPKETKECASPASGNGYDIDPITMKKIPRINNSPTPPPEKKPLLSTLFSEHGAVDIPVKTYKPHKVYGYGASNHSRTEPMDQPSSRDAVAARKGMENSRLRELQHLKATTLGTSIDTTAEYGGKYTPKADTASKLETKATPEALKPRQPDQATEDNAPLFSGTTYQSKADKLLSHPKSNTDWLQKEGFQTVNEALKSKETPTLVELNSSKERMETALDRHIGSRSSGAYIEPKEIEASYTSNSQKQTEEDTDLLRASDVRAAARTARTTKQQAQQAKRVAREKLERDFEVRRSHIRDDELIQEAKWARNLKTAWKHISEYPQGVVAKTMQSLGLYNSNFKNYVRLDKSPVDLTEKLIFKDESLSNVASIYKKRPVTSTRKIDTFTPSQEVVKADQETKARRAALQRSTEDAQRREAKLTAEASELAADIRSAYESQYGLIDANHRQVKPAAADAKTPDQQTSTDDPVKKSHPLLTASPLPGTELDSTIQEHTQTFEPRVAELKDQARAIRRSLHEIGLQTKALKSHRPQTYWNADIAPPRASDTEAIRSGIAVSAEQPLKADEALEKPVIIDSNPTTRIASILQRHENPTFLFLAYSSDSGDVDASSLSWKVFRKQEVDQVRDDMASVLTRLNQPSKYMKYFAPLEAAGYELYKGGQDSLIFKRISKEALTAAEQADLTERKIVPLDSQEVSTIPEEQSASKKAAEVLDDIPPEVGPQPGPAAPTAPTPTTRHIRRQEEVFSGQSIAKKPIADDGSKAGAAEDVATPLHDAATRANQSQNTRPDQRESIWRRFARGVRRVVLTGAAMAGFAYTIGVVAESVGAQSSRKRIMKGEEGRPSGIRPGIYSTESSRW